MDLFSSSPLMESFPTTRFPSPNPSPSPTRTESDLPIEVDQSFNSSMSLSCGDASPTPSAIPFKKPLSGSPLPKGTMMRRPDPVPIQRKKENLEVPTALTLGSGSASSSKMMHVSGSKRAFGQELSLNTRSPSMMRPSALSAGAKSKGKMLPPAVPAKGGVPMQFTQSNDETTMPKFPYHPAFIRRETEPVGSMSPISANESMDVDSPLPSLKGSPAPSSLSASPGLGSFFCDSPAPPSALPPAKRRSLVSNSPASPASPSAKRALLARPAAERAQSSGMLFGGKPPILAARRNQPYKRPSPLPTSTINDRSSACSAYPILSGSSGAMGGSFARPMMTAPMRRAFSVCDQQGHATEDEEDEYEDSPSTSAHAEYARRHGQSYTARVDGSPGFRPNRNSTPAKSSVSKGKKISPAPGLPDFGDEMKGKILPCHKVREDGLARISSDTLNGLLSGQYSDRLKRYHILDCRFDYEYEGGHIDGALHVKSMEALDELLLAASSGVHKDGAELPTPSRSGELEDGEQVVLIFHCEFSAKRAPTFAKHLRSRDRMLNNNLYPKVYYPEVYILEGGYCEFFKKQAHRCQPQAYVPMDDPRHFERRNSDLHDFRKFARTRSFTYGETQPPISAFSTTGGSSRPNCPPLAFAAASAAVGRRQGPTITEEEDDHNDTSAIESSPEIGSPGGPGNNDSPCPRVVSLGCPPVFGSAKPRQLARMGFHRVASYAGTTGPS